VEYRCCSPAARSGLCRRCASLARRACLANATCHLFCAVGTEDEQPEGYEQLPKLIRKIRLGYDATLLCVLLREELRRYEEEEVHNERCAVETDRLFEQWKAFFPPQADEVRQRREFLAALRKLEDLGFSRKINDTPECWEVRRILKARLPVSELENLKGQLLAAATGLTSNNSANDSDE
jgi:hypothetical protein